MYLVAATLCALSVAGLALFLPKVSNDRLCDGYLSQDRS
jgi:hypothetical protein